MKTSSPDSHIRAFMLLLLRKSPLRVLSILWLSVAAGVSGAVFIILMLSIVQSFSVNTPPLVMLLALPVIAAALMLCKYFSWQQASHFLEETLESLIHSIADHVRRSELQEIEALDHSELYARILNAQTITEMAVRSLDMFQHVITVSLCWVYLFFLSPLAGVVFAGLVGLSVLIYEVFQHVQKPLLRTEQHASRELFRIFDHFLDGFREVKVNQSRNESLFHHYLRPLAQRIQLSRIRLAHTFTDYFHLVNFGYQIMLGVCAFVLSARQTPVEVLMIVSLVLYLWQPIVSVLSGLPAFVQGKAAFEQLYQFAPLSSELSQRPVPVPRRRITAFQRIRFENVQFRYAQDEQFTLGPLNLTIKAGELLFFAGGNGSGKSTFMKVLCGLYAPTAGTVTIDAVAVRPRQYRALFGAVFSDAHLFDALYGLDDVEPQQVERWLARVDLAQKTRLADEQTRPFTVTSLQLSKGQQKRLALVMALLEDKPIYIFDEWAAEQDPQFRRDFYEIMLPELKAQGKTLLVVTHDDRYFHLADRIIALENGQIIAEGIPSWS